MAIQYLHNVLFNFKYEVQDVERKRVVASIASQRNAPGVVSIMVARNLLYEPELPGYEWIVMLDFVDEEHAFAFRHSADHIAQVAHDFTPHHSGYIAFNLRQEFDRKIAERVDNQFRHIEMFNFKEKLGDSERESILEAAKRQGDEPIVKRMFIGKNVRPNAENAPFDWMLVMEFANRKEYDLFKGSITYQKFRSDIFSPACNDTVVLDVIIPEADEI